MDEIANNGSNYASFVGGLNGWIVYLDDLSYAGYTVSPNDKTTALDLEIFSFKDFYSYILINQDDASLKKISDLAYLLHSFGHEDDNRLTCQTLSDNLKRTGRVLRFYKLVFLQVSLDC